MSAAGLTQAQEKMRQAGVSQAAIDVFTHYYGQLEVGATGLILEDSIEPLTDPDRLAGVEIGEDCVLHSGVQVREGCRLGRRVVVQNGSVLGGDGFGFARDAQGRYEKIPQLGIVVVEDDVEIGALVAIDRAALKQTRIGRGYFITWVTTFRDERGEVVGRQTFRILRFVPDPAALS